MSLPTNAALSPAELTAEVSSNGIVAILRAPTARHFPHIVETLLESGVRTVEVTLTAVDAIESIAHLSKTFGSDAIIGAGTVITADSAEACIEAGARFIVSPTASPDVVATSRIAGVAAYAGALTPTEALAVHMSGASAVKLFPASAVGPEFIKDLRGPLPDIQVMPTGGIAIDDIGAWISCGAAAVGLGSPLIGSAGVDGGTTGLRERTRRALDAVTEGRSNHA